MPFKGAQLEVSRPLGFFFKARALRRLAFWILCLCAALRALVFLRLAPVFTLTSSTGSFGRRILTGDAQ